MRLFDPGLPIQVTADDKGHPTFFRWNGLRHTYASRLVEGGMSPPQVAKLLGHTDELLVVRVYFDAGPVTHESAAAAIAASIPRRKSFRDT